MDCYVEIPYCAQVRNTVTMIIRNNMDSTSCSHPEICSSPDCQDVSCRPSDCENCTRTRLYANNSDCDSGIVENVHKTYKVRRTRSRFVNVCAAVCLLLLVGGLSPQSLAAPHRNPRIMERQRRASGTSQENQLWANPCDYNDSYSQSALKYSPKLAKEVASQARNAVKSTAEYKDKFASKLHSYTSFDALLQEWSSYDWLRKFHWFREEVLPKEKVINQPMPDEYMDQLMTKIDEVLPSMYKGLKMVVAGLYAISNEGLNDNIISDETLKDNIVKTMHDVRGVLCLFNDIMTSRNLQVMPLPDSEVPDFKTDDTKLIVVLLVYRDTINYLEYLGQVFQKMYDVDPDKTA